MPKRVHLPDDLLVGPFLAREGALLVGEPALRSRRLVRPYRGVRSVVDDTSLLGRCRAYAARMTPGQCFSHTTAAALWGIPLPAVHESEQRIHVSALDGTRPRLCGVVGHDLQSSRVRLAHIDDLPVTDAVSTFLQVSPMLAFDDLVAAADHLILTPRSQAVQTRPFVKTDELVASVRHFHGRGKTVARSAVRWMRDGAESRQETRLRLDLLRAGLPDPELNTPICDEAGRFLAFGDIVYPMWKVLVEYDGDQHRTSTEQYRRDIERHDALARAEWTHLRGGLHTPEAGPHSLPSLTRAALTHRGWSAEPSLYTPPGRFWRGK
jgi:very-short-patch-repair endonuclease